MKDRRLIERWLPIAELGVESLRERTPMTPFPAPNRLHVWWARRPLVAARAAVLASLLPEDADRNRFLHAIGIHGDPVASRRRIDAARRRGTRFEGQAYSYPRAFSHIPDPLDCDFIANTLGGYCGKYAVLDPTAGGGSIPFETKRLGFEAFANDLNPVATLVMRATIEWPSRFNRNLSVEFNRLSQRFVECREDRIAGYFPQEPAKDCVPANYLWARTIICPYCGGQVPLSPNWRLAPGGIGVRLVPDTFSGPSTDGRTCSFEIVRTSGEQSAGTVARGDGVCPFGDCGRVIDGDEIKRQARDGRMGEQLFAVVYKRRVRTMLKSGKRGRDRWVREYRAPRPVDDNSAEIRERLEEKLPEWEVFDVVPTESYDDMYCDRSKIYGVWKWRDLFSPRQLLCHGTSVEVFREMLEADRVAGRLSEVRKAAYGYLAITLDKLLNYNSRMSVWMPTRALIANTFNRHDFAFCWSHAEMAPLVVGPGYDWAVRQTAKCIQELLDLTDSEASASGSLPLHADSDSTGRKPPPVTVTCKSADRLDHIPDSSVDAVVMDPPYYDNVMYAELSDFFYVWLKRTAGRVYPALFRRRLTDKDGEATANPMRFRGRSGAKALSGLDYQDRMAAIFAECRRMLKSDGILTLMFTHKATGAWDALTKGLIEAGFVITASWPINTESSGSLHIKDKAAANSTVFLACRPRAERSVTDATAYWEDVEPKVASAVRERVAEFRGAGIQGVDLYLACFGPALEEFSRHWPLERGQPRRKPEPKAKSRQQSVPEQEWDPYAVTPEDALDVASREVKRWRLEQLTHRKAHADLDAPTAFFVLAWDTFNAPVFSYDEALRLARAVGTDLDKQVVKRLAEKNGSNLRLWDSVRRSAKGSLGPVDGSRGMIDAIHHAARLARNKSLAAARDLLAKARVDKEPRFFAALEAVLEVLPISTKHTGVQLEGDLAASATDFEVLYDLYRLAYSDKIDEPEQLKIWRDDLN